MMFPDKYKCLIQNSFEYEDYKIVPIRFNDRFSIMKWRNEQMYHLRQSEIISNESQENYFKNTLKPLFHLKKPNQILFSYLKGEECVGYGGLVHVDWINRKAEVSFIMNTILEKNEFELHWTNFLNLIVDVAFDNLKFKNIFTYAYNLREHLYPILEKNFFYLKSTLKNEIIIDGIEVDVLIHERKNLNESITLRKSLKSDVKLIFDWANDKLVRKQSYNQDKIIYKDHEKWYFTKINANNSYFLVNLFEGYPAGLVRFEIGKSNSEIGILIDSKFRKKGLSSVMLIKSVLNYFQIFDKPILAFIKKNNQPSIKAFEKAGFKFLENTIINEISSVVYVLKKKKNE